MNQITATTLVAEPGSPYVSLHRDFDAPRDLVFALLTDPEQIPLWWGPSYLTTRVDRMDPRSDGSWRFVQTAPDGTEHAFHGVYHDVSGPDRVVQTFEYEGVPGHAALETIVLEDLGDGRTRLTQTGVYQSLADRDMVVASGMESGAKETWERFAELLTKQS